MWLYFIITGLASDLLGAYFVVKSLLKLNPLTKHVGNLIKIILIGISSGYGMVPDDDAVSKMFDELEKEHKEIKKVKKDLKKLEENPTKFNVDDKRLILQQAKDALLGILILALGFVLQITGNVIQYYCSRPEVLVNLPEWCKI